MKLAFILATVLLMLFGCNLQHKLLYFPSSSLPSKELLAATQLTLWPSTSASNYRGLIASQEITSAAGTVIVFHGNGGRATDRIFYVETLAALGYRVILAEYPRYGGRKGDLGEKAFVADAGETTRLALAQFGPPLFLVGESLGCGIATGVVKDSSITIDGIILVTPWDTLAAIAQSKFPFLPLRPLLTDSYDNIGNLESFPGKIAVLGAGRDEVIPFKHADNLFRFIANPAKRMWLIPTAGHNDVLFYTNQERWQEIMDFVKSPDKK